MRDTWPNARVRKNVSLIRTYHGFKGTKSLLQCCWLSMIWHGLIEWHLVIPGDKQGTLEFLKLIFRALCLCWDRQTQDLHIDWILFRGRSLNPVSCEVVSDNIDGFYPSSHYPIFAEFMLPRTVRLLEPSTQEENWNNIILEPFMPSPLYLYLIFSFGVSMMIFKCQLGSLGNTVDIISFWCPYLLYCFLTGKFYIWRKFSFIFYFPGNVRTCNLLVSLGNAPGVFSSMTWVSIELRNFFFLARTTFKLVLFFL